MEVINPHRPATQLATSLFDDFADRIELWRKGHHDGDVVRFGQRPFNIEKFRLVGDRMSFGQLEKLIEQVTALHGPVST